MIRVASTAAHQDERGTISDLLTEPFDALTEIDTKAGAIRGNHYHRRTWQWTYVVSGTLRVITQSVDTCVDPPELVHGTRDVGLVRTRELIVSPPEEAHAWEALEDTVVVVLTRGPRSGEGYESDVYRLGDDQKLIA